MDDQGGPSEVSGAPRGLPGQSEGPCLGREGIGGTSIIKGTSAAFAGHRPSQPPLLLPIVYPLSPPLILRLLLPPHIVWPLNPFTLRHRLPPSVEYAGRVAAFTTASKSALENGRLPSCFSDFFFAILLAAAAAAPECGFPTFANVVFPLSGMRGFSPSSAFLNLRFVLYGRLSPVLSIRECE